MTNAQWLASFLRTVAERLEAGQMDEVILSAARSTANDSGWMYDLWCDSCGNCGSGDDMCPDGSQLACIRRFLDREHTGLCL